MAEGSDELIKLYLKDVRKIPLLSPEDERRLARQIRQGRKRARDLLTLSNLRLVVSIAKKYARSGLPFPDVIEEGNLGLMRAVSKYDPRRGYRFSTYATWWIKQSILRALAEQSKTIRIPVYMVDTVAKWKRSADELTQKLHRAPTAEEIAKKMRISVKKARGIEKLMVETSSLNVQIGDEGYGEFLELIEDKNVPEPTKEMGELIRKEKVNEILDMLSKKEREVLVLRYGIGTDTRLTLEQTSKRFDVSRERIRQIEENAVNKLKKILISRWEDYEDLRGG